MDDSSNPRLTRRAALSWIGAGTVAVVAAACGDSSPRDSASPSTSSPTSASSGTSAATSFVGPTPSCVLMPEMTEGPYYIADEAIRRDITEGKPGVPLRLDLTVVDAAACTPVSGATVEIWHADAAGDYSGFGDASANRTFLRGGQKTGADGLATFDTIYPGWYQGRAVHIHLKVHDGSRTHTGQLFFDDTVSEAVYAQSPYDEHDGRWVRTSQDGIYRSGGAPSTVALRRDGAGYIGALSLGVERA